MNQSLRSIFLLAWCAALLVSSCNGPGNRNDDGRDSVLTRPPFTLLTDSIKQSKTNSSVLAGLYFRRGELLSQNNRHELAAEDYKKAWELHPDDLTGLRFASTLSIIGRADEAVELLKDCLLKFPSNEAFTRLLGENYMQSGKLREALKIYDGLIKNDSLNSEAWYEKGLLIERAGDTTSAIAALKKAYALQPTNTYALELAHLYAESGNSMALSICDEILRKDSARQLLDPLFIKGIYYSNTQQYKKAIVQFDSCIGRDWKFTDAYLEKGIALYKQKNYTEAMNTFRMAVTVSNTYPDAYYWMGRCYEALGKKEDAIDYYERAVSLDRNFIEAKQRLKALKS